METFFHVKLKLIYNTSVKGIQVEYLISAETEDSARTIIETHFQKIISHPKKTVYKFSKEADKYVPIILDAGISDERLVSIEIISAKESTICCFWGNRNAPIYLAKIGADYTSVNISINSIQNIAIGANDFDEAYSIIKNTFKDDRYVAKQLFSKKISDYDCNHATFYIYSIKKSKLSVIS